MRYFYAITPSSIRGLSDTENTALSAVIRSADRRALLAAVADKNARGYRTRECTEAEAAAVAAARDSMADTYRAGGSRWDRSFGLDGVAKDYEYLHSPFASV